MTGAVWALLVLALVGANLPFFVRRKLFILKTDLPKSFAWHSLELLLMYLLVGAAGLLMEQSLGQIAPQRWEFYAITGCLFITFAFPGFVWRFLLKH